VAKKLAGMALTMVMGISVLSGCGASDDSKNSTVGNPQNSGSTQSKVITITVRENTWGARKDNFLEAEKRLNEELKADQTQIKIDWWPGIDDDELVLQGQAGKIADVFINSSVDIGWQRDAGIIRDIDWAQSSAVFKNVPPSYTNIMRYDGHY